MSVRKTILLFGGVLLIGQAIMLAFLLPQIAKAQIVADHLVISEIQTGLSGTGNSQKDFIEIYNPTDSDIDLDGYRLVKRTKSATTDTTIKSWTSTTIVPAKSFYLWVNSNYTELASVADATTTQSIADDNAVALRQGGEDTGTIIDAVAWGENASGLGGGANFPENIPDDQSLERIADTDDNSSDFVIQASPNPKGLVNNAPDDTTEQDEQTEEAKENDTEDNEEQSDEEEIGENDKDGEEETSPPPITGGQANIDASPPILAVFINELMPNPKGIDQGNEWVEIYNGSSFDVDIGGWVLDDDIGLTPGNNAYKLPSEIIIPANGYKAILIPKGKFALNNDSDIVRLFNSNLTLVDQISYQGPAIEGESFAKNNNGLWQWTSITTPDAANQFTINIPTDEKDSEIELEDDNKYKNVNVVFNEVFGNPQGADVGQEWVELLNRGDNEVDLSGWFIDDDGTTISSNAYRLPSGSVIQPYGLLLVNLPEDSSFITNTEEILRLLDSDGQEIVRVVTPELPQGLSFARESIDSDEWDFSAIPTPGEHNEFASRPARVIISEIYYRPVGDDEDFIELYNRESIWVDLQGWKIKAGNTEYIFPKGASIAPQSYLLLMGEIINVRINDSNIEYLRLLRPDGAEQDNWGNKGNIPSPQAGQSLMVSDSSVMVTNSPTPGWANKRTNLASMSGTLASRINIVSPVAANTSAEAGVVAGDSVQVESDSASNSSSAQDLPIIIESNQNKGFFHRIKRFFCVVSFGLLKC